MSQTKERIVIVGSMGQVGRALWENMTKKFFITGHDLKPRTNSKGDEIPVKANPEECKGEIMHVCIPWSDKFRDIISALQEEFSPELIVIHSSLPPGTTSSLVDKGMSVVHSPVVFDIHHFPSLGYFKKLVGYDNTDLALKAEKHLRKAFNTALVNGSRNTEMSDLCMGLYSMTCRAITFEIHRMFEIAECDYSNFMEFVHYSNYGYAAMNKGDMLLFNQFPDLNKRDYRVELTKLIPEELLSAFFKLGEKSYELQQKEREKVHAEIQESARSYTRP